MATLKWKSYKDPQEYLDFVFDWTDRLGEDTIDTATVSVVSGSVTIDDFEFTNKTVTVWLNGGEEGESCPILCEIQTAGGRLRQQTAVCRIKTK